MPVVSEEIRRPLPSSFLRTPARMRVAFGPESPGWGSWDWVGADLARELAASFETASFVWGELPECRVAVIVKHLLPAEAIDRLARRTAIVYAPVDAYGGEAEITADAARLRRCARIVVHCERLLPYFKPFAPVEYMDHHLKFVSRQMANDRGQGGRRFVLWVGVRSNLRPLVEWVNRHALELPLVVLTNVEEAFSPVLCQRGMDERRNDMQSVDRTMAAQRDLAAKFGFASDRDVCIEKWSAERQRELTALATAAIDIKGNDFRQLHKPPAKAIDFIASGLPLAMNESSSTEHLARMGFEIASPDDPVRWFSRDYREETVAFGRELRELLSLKRLGMRWRNVLGRVARSRE